MKYTWERIPRSREPGKVSKDKEKKKQPVCCQELERRLDQWVRVGAALLEDPGSVSSPTWWLTTI